jgi:DNA polymerase-3 subunit epsilon
MRQVVLDTETTGLDPQGGHRIIEIGCVEISHRRLTGSHYQQFLDPKREVDEGAAAVHGLTSKDLSGRPEFVTIVDDFMEFVKGAELIIHNAPFDLGFINMELERIESKWDAIENYCGVLDTLNQARNLHPGQRNSLDALCKRYDVSNSHRELHGALLDAELLAEVYLAMTGGQESLDFESSEQAHQNIVSLVTQKTINDADLVVVPVSDEELKDHAETLSNMTVGSLWKTL